MRLLIMVACVAVGFTLYSPRLLHAETAAEMLEKGIYNEETVGNLDEAIKLYRQVLDVASETERLAANAQFRLVQCLLKQQKEEEAIRAFKTLVEKYPEQRELIAKAKRQLPEQQLPNELKLSKAPWKDGERLTLEMKLAGGQTIGLIGLGVDSSTADDKDVWKMSVRRFVSDGQNEGVSLITVDKSSNRPRSTTWNHTMLGTANADWDDDRIVISSTNNEGKTEQKTIDLDDVAFSNDQLFYGFRQLPLAVGYKATIPIRVAFTGGNPIGLEVEVKEKETIKTSVGEFESFRLETNIAQTFWIADVPERYPVKFTAGGVDALLTSINTGKEPTKIENEKLGVSLTVPSGWFYLEYGSPNEDSATSFRLVAPQMASAIVSVKDKSLLDSGDRKTLATWAESKINRGKRTFKQYEIRAGSMQDTRLAGVAAKTYIADREFQGRAYSHEVALALTDSKAVATSTAALKSQFDDVRESFDAIRKSISVK